MWWKTCGYRISSEQKSITLSSSRRKFSSTYKHCAGDSMIWMSSIYKTGCNNIISISRASRSTSTISMIRTPRQNRRTTRSPMQRSSSSQQMLYSVRSNSFEPTRTGRNLTSHSACGNNEKQHIMRRQRRRCRIRMSSRTSGSSGIGDTSSGNAAHISGLVMMDVMMSRRKRGSVRWSRWYRPFSLLSLLFPW